MFILSFLNFAQDIVENMNGLNEFEDRMIAKHTRFDPSLTMLVYGCFFFTNEINLIIHIL